jgi:uncharacterized membrane protein YebE (DUF533 family)
MGFLDRVVGDLISDATGLPVKGLVRKVGAKNLLMLGGMAAAGGYAVHRMSQGRQPPPAPPAPPASRQDLPPLPPIPQGTAPPPPPAGLPPVPPGAARDAVPPPPPGSPDTGTGAEMPDHLVLAVVRTMVAAALADGRMTPQERAAIQSHLSDAGLRPEDVEQVHQDLVLPATPEELAALEPDPGRRPVLLRAALLILQADAEISGLERAWLERLGAALGLDEARQRELEHDLLAAARTAPDDT